MHVTATWYPEVGRAQVDIAKGPHFNTIGKSDSSGKVWLQPEELIYLVERGSLECFWPQGAPMSLQGTYSACIKNQGDLERLQVYTYLKKLGFILQRAPSYDNDYPTLENSPYKVQPKKEKITSILFGYASISFFRFYNQLFLPTIHAFQTSTFFITGISPLRLRSIDLNQKILLSKPIYRSYEAIYDDLDIIPHHDPPHTNVIHTPIDTPEPTYPYRVAFHVWKPTAGSFKKSAPGDPDFRIAVVSARDTRVPTLSQALSLLNSVPVTESGYMQTNSRKKKALEAAAAAAAAGKKIEPQRRTQTWVLKDGWRNVVLAVIDAGVISFTKIADSGFGEEKIYNKGIQKKRPGRPNSNRQPAKK